MRAGRRARRVAVVLAVLGLLSGATWYALTHLSTVVVAECTGTVKGDSYDLDPDQAENATTIAVEAHRLGLPAHAVSVGLAAALQESKLRNLDYGDRDSLGLFQQRPSQGWGTPAQLQQPAYAAAAFFKGLRKVEGWETLPIYQAAQRVQRSADATAYAVWDTEARTLAQVLTGQVPAGYTCRYPSIPKPRATTSQALSEAIASSLGPEAVSASVERSYGWTVASWLISRAPTYSITRVSFDGWTWTSKRNSWRRDATHARGQVSYSLRSGS